MTDDLERQLESVWQAAIDASTSRDFRDQQGALDEPAYLRYKANTIAQAAAHIREEIDVPRSRTQPPLTPEQRSLRARIAAHSKWAKTPDPAAATAAARQAALDRFERQVDPDGTMPPAERARRAEHARKAYFAGLALKSARAAGAMPPSD